MIIAIPVCVALIITAAAWIILAAAGRGRKPYQPGHSRRPAPAPAPPRAPAPAAVAGPCTPHDLTAFDLPPVLARPYARPGSGPRDRS